MSPRLRVLGVLASALLAGGCQALRQEPHHLSGATHWYRDSAEAHAIYEQTYRAAEQSVRMHAAGLPARSWAVILDVDETVLDNSEYQKELDLAGVDYTESTWNQWVARGAAVPLPGAAAFTSAVRQMQGQVILVTNRMQAQCPGTEENLRKAGILFDRLLCQTDTADKNPRFRSIQEGTSEGTAPLQILAWVGDNIRDFPGLSQHEPDLGEFGTRFFMLPNPLYGSWEGNPAK
jgi:5'-nucleotidase (lipoprotein e(P4) family)